MKTSINHFHHPYTIHAMLQTKRGIDYLSETLRYNFADLPQDAIKSMIDKMAHLASISEEQIPDDVYLITIFSIYIEIPATDKKYPLPFEEFLNGKAKKIADLIGQTLGAGMAGEPSIAGKKAEAPKAEDGKAEVENAPPSSSESSPDEGPKGAKGKLLDVGAGDGNMSHRVGSMLDLSVTGIDVTSEGFEEWAGESGSNQLSKINLVLYDGVDLKAALKEDTHNYTKPYSVIMFNHSLHHYPSFQDQVHGVRQAIDVLKIGGVLFFSEHGNTLSDHQLHLQHVLFDIRTKIDRLMKAEKNSLRLHGQISKTIKTYAERKSTENYFSRPQLTKLITEFGLELAQSDVRVHGFDASQTVFYCFRKTKRFSQEDLLSMAPASTNKLENKDKTKRMTRKSSFEEGDIRQFNVRKIKLSTGNKSVLIQQKATAYSFFSGLFSPRPPIKPKREEHKFLMFNPEDENSFIKPSSLNIPVEQEDQENKKKQPCKLTKVKS